VIVCGHKKAMERKGRMKIQELFNRWRGSRYLICVSESEGGKGDTSVFCSPSPLG